MDFFAPKPIALSIQRARQKMKRHKIIQKRYSSKPTPLALICLIASLAFLLASCGKEEEQAVEEVISPVKV
ncbi:MAG: hypothetical protein JSV16_02550, partial [Candidatus Hydrogenedentota bacterium]